MTPGISTDSSPFAECIIESSFQTIFTSSYLNPQFYFVSKIISPSLKQVEFALSYLNGCIWNSKEEDFGVFRSTKVSFLPTDLVAPLPLRHRGF